MDEKKHCKWYHEEFCTNDKSPCVADYCPCVEYPELCKLSEDNVVNDLVNEEYRLRGKTYFEVAEIVKKLRITVENPQVTIEDKFKIVAKFMQLMEQFFHANGV